MRSTFSLPLFCTLAVAQVVQWPVEHKHRNIARLPTVPVTNGPAFIPPRRHLGRRATGKTVLEVIANDQEQGGYFCTVAVGTPPQNLTLQLDTGSSDVWVPWLNASICVDTSIAGGCTLGAFNPDDSSTFEDVGQDLFEITFVDNSKARGDYFQDRFSIGDVTVENMTMGIAVDTSIPYGLVGVGYSSNEAITEFGDDTYPNLPVALNDMGAINSIAYSLWLNDLDASTGSILFGGIDTEKFVGNMTRINVLKEKTDPAPYHFTVALTSLTAKSSSGEDTLTSSSFPIEAVLDSGTTLTYLPQDLAEQIWKEVGAEYDDSQGGALIPCSFAKTSGYFSFGFAGPDGPRINVTMDELVLSMGDERGPQSTFQSGAFKGQSSCAFGIQNYTDSPVLLGDTFLRSAYVVYDLVNNEIGIAATDFNATKTNIVPFASKGARIPSSTSAPNQDQVSNASGSSTTTTGLSAADGFKKGANSTDNKSEDSPASHLAPSLAIMSIMMTFTMLGGGIFATLL